MHNSSAFMALLMNSSHFSSALGSSLFEDYHKSVINSSANAAYADAIWDLSELVEYEIPVKYRFAAVWPDDS